ncbi:MAG: hypothetical protein U1E62_17725 [Alsobacter sp.]
MADWTTEGLNAALARRAPARLPAGPGPVLARFALRHPRLALVALAMLAGGIVSMPFWLGRGAREADPAEPPPTAAEAPAWVPILQPRSAFALDTPLFPRDQQRLEARRHNPGGGREDIFLFGDPTSAQGQARVVVYRTGGEANRPGSLYLELARRAAEDGQAVMRTTSPETLPTRFGPVETAVLDLADGANGRQCSAWRIVAEEQDLRVTGWICGPQGRPVERHALTCLIERLDLSPATQPDPELKAYFLEAEKNRTPGCPSPRPVPAGRRPA